MRIKINLTLLLFSLLSIAEAQIKYNSWFYERFWDVETEQHQAIKSPHSEGRFQVFDSTMRYKLPIANKYLNLVANNVLNSNIISLEKEDYGLYVQPLWNSSVGQSNSKEIGLKNFSRGIVLEGFLSDNVGIWASYNETQSILPLYLDNYINKNRVIPGVGMRRFYGNEYDYSHSTGGIWVKPEKRVLLELGYDRNFWAKVTTR